MQDIFTINDKVQAAFERHFKTPAGIFCNEQSGHSSMFQSLIILQMKKLVAKTVDYKNKGGSHDFC